MSFTRTLGRPMARLLPRASARRAAPRRRLRSSPRMRLAVLVAVLLAAVGLGGWMWLRDSSLAAVSQVTITGESGADAGAIRSALRAAARNMTTLDVQMSQLRTAVAPFPEVRRLRVRTAFPHRMVIEVIEQRPVGVLEAGGRAVAVAGDGTILRAVTASSSLPAIPLGMLPAGRRVRESQALQAVALLSAAPYQVLARISQVTEVAGHGLVAQLRNGPSILFGDARRLSAKWVAATQVLADPSSAGASYIDVTDPARPAAGAGASGGATSAAGPATPSTSSPPAAASQAQTGTTSGG